MFAGVFWTERKPEVAIIGTIARRWADDKIIVSLMVPSTLAARAIASKLLLTFHAGEFRVDRPDQVTVIGTVARGWADGWVIIEIIQRTMAPRAVAFCNQFQKGARILWNLSCDVITTLFLAGCSTVSSAST